MSRTAALVMTAVLALSLISCGGGSSSPQASDKTTTTAAAGTTTSKAATTSTTSIGSTLQPGDPYVALGSSIASGFGLATQPTSCGRSNHNYPTLIAAQYHLDLTDVTCGAATTPNVVDTPQGANPPQIDAVKPDTKLITVSVGGNDLKYNGTAVACGDPTNVCKASPTLDADLATTRTALADMLQKLRAKAPDATIVFVTYPREVPEGNCPALGFTDAEADIVRTMGTKLEDVFTTLPKVSNELFIDPYPAKGDHTGCAAEDERWTAGNKVTDGFAYHPTALGHQVMAKMIADALGKQS
jgi:lysophospholipase L1-like esterase